jgi:hypothetical protein
MSTPTLASRPAAIAPALPPLLLPLAASAIAWGLLFAILPPAQQDFPLNDDWAFARGAFGFAQGRGIAYSGWASMPQLGQWLWACPFVWLFGESHFALRLSTILLSWVGLAAFFDLLRQAGVAPRRAALATATLAFCPLFFLLQGTFMTDVPALALALAALALYARALRGHRAGWLIAGCAVAVLAVLTRQNTLAVPAAAAVLLLRDSDLRRRMGWWFAVLLPVAVGAVTHLWFSTRDDVRALTPALPAPADLLALPFVTIHLFGLASLPLLATGWRGGSLKSLGIAFAVLLACAGYWIYHGQYLPYEGLFPYTENLLTPWGAFAGSRSTGPFIVGQRPLLLGTLGRGLLTLLGCAAGALLVTHLVRQWRPGAWAAPLTLFTLFSAVFVLLAPDFYDRYLIFLLPGVLALAASGEPGPAAAEEGPRRLAGGVAIVALGAVSFALMHDWLSWNAARWELGRRAIARHIDPHDIEGGVEWDAWHTSLGSAPARPSGAKWPLPFTREWFPAVTGRYALSFSDVRGMRRLDAEPYDLWLSPGPREFLLLELQPLPTNPGPRAGDTAKTPSH